MSVLAGPGVGCRCARPPPGWGWRARRHNPQRARRRRPPLYPYLLRGLTIARPNQVWATDITYIPMARGFAYLVAIIDWYSRRVLAWRLSNTLDTGFCLEALRDALAHFGRPTIFNTDPGSQFTAGDFTRVLRDRGIKISMDGKGRPDPAALKYEGRLRRPGPRLRAPA